MQRPSAPPSFAGGYASDGEAVPRRQARAPQRRAAPATTDRATSPVAIPGVEILVNGALYQPPGAARAPPAASPPLSQQPSLAEAPPAQPERAPSAVSDAAGSDAERRASGAAEALAGDPRRSDDGGVAEVDATIERGGSEASARGSGGGGAKAASRAAAAEAAPDADGGDAVSALAAADAEGAHEGAAAVEEAEDLGGEQVDTQLAGDEPKA